MFLILLRYFWYFSSMFDITSIFLILQNVWWNVSSFCDVNYICPTIDWVSLILIILQWSSVYPTDMESFLPILLAFLWYFNNICEIFLIQIMKLWYYVYFLQY
jgi:hypothetical protein